MLSGKDKPYLPSSHVFDVMVAETRSAIDAIYGVAGCVMSENDRNSLSNPIMTRDHVLSLYDGFGAVAALLDLPGIETDCIHLEEHPYNLAMLVYDISNITRTRLIGQPLRLCVVWDDGLPPELIGDMFRVRQVMSAILTQAERRIGTGEIGLTLHSEHFEDGVLIVFEVSGFGTLMNDVDTELFFEDLETERVILEYMEGEMRFGEDKSAGYTLMLTLPQGTSELDIDAGLENIGGDMGEYVKMIAIFVRESAELSEKLTAAMDDDDWKNYSIYAHALKGMCAGIGAKRISGLAYALEQASKAGQIEYCAQETEPFLDALVSLRKEIEADKTIAKEILAAPTIKKDISEVKDTLRQIYEKCDDLDGTSARRLCEGLLIFDFGEEINKKIRRILESVDSFDLDEAMEEALKLSE